MVESVAVTGTLDLLHAAVFIALALVVLVIRMRLRHRSQARGPASDEECLDLMALARHTSVFALFLEAGQEWHLDPERVETDFHRYLQGHDLPHYVRDYVRKNARDEHAQCRARLHPGGELPPSWMA
jgi:hypothetical protein